MDRKPDVTPPRNNVFAPGTQSERAALQAKQHRCRTGKMVVQRRIQCRIGQHLKSLFRGRILKNDLTEFVRCETRCCVIANQNLQLPGKPAVLPVGPGDNAADHKDQGRKSQSDHDRGLLRLWRGRIAGNDHTAECGGQQQPDPGRQPAGGADHIHTRLQGVGHAQPPEWIRLQVHWRAEMLIAA